MKASAGAHSIYRSRTMTIKTMKRINLKIHQNTLKESTSITIIFSKLFTLHTPQNVHIIGQSAPMYRLHESALLYTCATHVGSCDNVLMCES